MASSAHAVVYLAAVLPGHLGLGASGDHPPSAALAIRGQHWFLSVCDHLEQFLLTPFGYGTVYINKRRNAVPVVSLAQEAAHQVGVHRGMTGTASEQHEEGSAALHFGMISCRNLSELWRVHRGMTGTASEQHEEGSAALHFGMISCRNLSELWRVHRWQTASPVVSARSRPWHYSTAKRPRRHRPCGGYPYWPHGQFRLGSTTGQCKCCYVAGRVCTLLSEPLP